MAHITADRVRDTSTSTGTGTIVVSGTAPASFRTFSAVLSTSDTFYYAIQHQTVSEWEVGLGTYSSANTITRTTVLASSAGGSAVSFSAGTKDVFITLAATKTVQQGPGGETTVTANSTSDALRVTQTGTGNAFVVEDSASPDSTPFVIDADGNVVVGGSSVQQIPAGDGANRSGSFQVQGGLFTKSSISAIFYNTVGSGGSSLSLARSNTTTLGAHSVVANSDVMGSVFFSGSDGAAFVRGAQITAAVDGTPGTNDMPGRLTFLTTADGASTPTERMRINNAGNVGLNVSSVVAKLHAVGVGETTAPTVGGSKAATIFINSSSNLSNTGGAIEFGGQSGTTFAAWKGGLTSGTANTIGYLAAYTRGATADAAMTERMRLTSDGNLGLGITAPTAKLNIVEAGSQDALRVTNTGTGNSFVVEDSASPDATPFVIDATGNVGVGVTVPAEKVEVAGNIHVSGGDRTIFNRSNNALAFGTNNTERMRLNAGGQVLFADVGSRSIGNVATSRIQVHSTNSDGFSGGVSAFAWDADSGGSLLAAGVVAFARSASDTTGTQAAVVSGNALGSVAFTGSDGTGFIRAANIAAFVDGTPGTNNMPGRLTFSTTASGASSPTERMRIDNAGQVGIGGTPSAGTTLRLGRNITGATTSHSLRMDAVVQSDVTNEFRGVTSFPSTQAASFTLGTVNHFIVGGITLGAGSSVTTQAGYSVSSSLTTGATNYGFYGNIAAGTGRWNFYANGTADNYFAGKVGIGNTTPAASAALDVTSTTAGVLFPRMTGTQRDAIASPANGLVLYNTTTDKLQVRAGGAWVDLH
jgi:hypothetical protein